MTGQLARRKEGSPRAGREVVSGSKMDKHVSKKRSSRGGAR